MSVVKAMAMTGLIQDCKSSTHGASSLCCVDGIYCSLTFQSKLSSVQTYAPSSESLVLSHQKRKA